MPKTAAVTETIIAGCCVIRRPGTQVLPVVFASPHSGQEYDAAFVASARLDEGTLRRSEDSFVDEIVGAAPELGAPLIAATFPRAYCDVNREAWELDPGMFEDTLPDWVNTTSPRVGAGLGTLARVVANGEAIYGIRLRFAEAQHRVQTSWQPYHDALAGLIAETQSRFGVCVLLDCHSMPASATVGRRPAPDIILGDVHGQACAPPLMRSLERFFTARGFLVRRNDPYAGGYVTRHYGRPSGRVHAVQIEFARSLYMNEVSLQKQSGFARLQADMRALLHALPDMVAGLLPG